MCSPFALVTRFEGDTEEHCEDPFAEAGFEQALLDLIPTTRLTYAPRTDVRSSHARARPVPKDSNSHPLADIAQLQTVFEFQDVAGVIVGFRTPDILCGIHRIVLHPHLITPRRKHGSHLLGAASIGVTVTLQHAPSIELGLPLTPAFLTMTRVRDMEAETDKEER